MRSVSSIFGRFIWKLIEWFGGKRFRKISRSVLELVSYEVKVVDRRMIFFIVSFNRMMMRNVYNVL